MVGEKIFLKVGFFSGIVVLCQLFGLAFAQEAITVSTYYPSPNGVYQKVQLKPSAAPLAADCDETSEEGTLYYDGSDHLLKICTDTDGTGNYQWQSAPGAWTGGDFWRASGNNIYKVNAQGNVGGYVGVGLSDPKSMMQIVSPMLVNPSVGVSSYGQYGILLCDCVNGKESIGMGMTWGADDMFWFNSRWGYIFYRMGNVMDMVIGKNGNVGIGINSLVPPEKLTVSGNVKVDGDIEYTGSCAASSDLRYKKDVQVLENVLDKLDNIRGVRYLWRGDEFPEKNFSSGPQVGIIAQEMEQEFPELVREDKDRYKSIDYSKFTAVLLQAIKEQQSQIDELKSELAEIID